MKNLRSIAILSASSVIAGAANYFYHPLMIRYLSLAEFAEFESLVGILNILWVLTVWLGLFLVKEISAHSGNLGRVGAVYRHSSRSLFALGMVIFAIFVALSPLIARFLKLDSVVPILLVASSIPVSFLGTSVSAVLNGTKKFAFMAASSVASSIFKLAFGFAFVALWFWLLGAVWGFVVTSFASLALSAWYVWTFLRGVRTEASDERTAADFLKDRTHVFQFFLLTLFLSALMNSDVILAKSLFDETLAGAYAGISILAKIVVFLGGSVESVYYPQIMEKPLRDSDARHVSAPFLIFAALGAGAYVFNSFFGYFALETMKAWLAPHLDEFLLLLVSSTFLCFASFSAKILVGWKKYSVNAVLALALVSMGLASRSVDTGGLTGFVVAYSCATWAAAVYGTVSVFLFRRRSVGG